MQIVHNHCFYCLQLHVNEHAVACKRMNVSDKRGLLTFLMKINRIVKNQCE